MFFYHFTSCLSALIVCGLYCFCGLIPHTHELALCDFGSDKILGHWGDFRTMDYTNVGDICIMPVALFISCVARGCMIFFDTPYRVGLDEMEVSIWSPVWQKSVIDTQR